MLRLEFTLLAATLGLADFAVPQEADSNPLPALPSYRANGIDFSGLADVYYSLNFNHPATHFNATRNFDVRADRPSLNMAKFTMEHSPGPIGFKLEIAGGRAMEIIHATEPSAARGTWEHIFQAFVSLKPAKMKGFQADFGKFVTSAGAEVTETHLNWNYSRSFLFANGPYYHTGLRTSLPVSKNFTAGVQLVNGWNNTKDNNSSKTVGLTAALTTPKVNWFNNYYVGNEKTDKIDGPEIDAPGLRHFYDTVVAVNPSTTITFLFNFDYGVEMNPGAAAFRFYGFSVANRIVLNSRFTISPRYDWYKDRDGFITTKRQTLQAFTLTGDWRFMEGILGRFEFRSDWSD